MITIDIVLSVCALMHSIGIVHIHCMPISNAEQKGRVLKRLCAYVSDPKLRNRSNTVFINSTHLSLPHDRKRTQARLKSTSIKNRTNRDTHTPSY